MTDWLEEFWADTLSEEPVRITAAWMRLTVEEQVAVRAQRGPSPCRRPAQ